MKRSLKILAGICLVILSAACTKQLIDGATLLLLWVPVLSIAAINVMVRRGL